MTKREIGVLFARILALFVLLRGAQMSFFTIGNLLSGYSEGTGLSLLPSMMQFIPYLAMAPVLWFGAERLTSLICIGGDLEAETVSFASAGEMSTLAFALFGLYTVSVALPMLFMTLTMVVQVVFEPYSGRTLTMEVANVAGNFLLIVLGTYLLFNSARFVSWLQIVKKD